MPKVIHSLLPVKEAYTRSNAGAVALCVNDGLTASKYADKAVIMGRHDNGKMLGEVPYQGLALKRAWLSGRNIGLANGYLDYIKGHGTPDLLEVHGRLQVAAHIGRKRPDLNMVLWLHNDPRDMKGGQSVEERRQLLERMSLVCCVSDYLRQCFLEELDVSAEMSAKVVVIPIAADRLQPSFPEKDRLITIVGRMVPEKGMLEAARALARVLPDFPDWSVKFIGAQKFAEASQSPYEKAIAAALENIAGQAEMTGFITREATQYLQDRSAIVLAPSQWQEPAGRVVVEALATGAALITTRRGGIPEYAEGRAVLLDRGDENDLAEALERMIRDTAWRQQWQQKAWQDYPFSVAHMVAKLDAARDMVLSEK